MKYLEIEIKIFNLIKSGKTPSQAAKVVLDSYPGWFKQTPEGEYLLEVIYQQTLSDEKESKRKDENG